MANKPRKPRRTTQELINEALANATIDAGTYGDEVPEVQEKRKRGNPGKHDWTRTDVVLDWYRSNRGNLKGGLPQEDFIETVRMWWREENPDKEPPHPKTIMKRLQKGPH